MNKENPLPEKDIKNHRIDPEEESDLLKDINEEEVVRIVMDDFLVGTLAMGDWLEDREFDIKMYDGARPSEIENLEKEDWQSDRNMGLCAATCDAYQATLMATCWNPETIHFIATEENDLDKRNNLAEFTKWMVSESECNITPEIDDFIHNRISQGVSVFKASWDVWYEWVDLRIPKFGTAGPNKGKFIGYDIETKYKRFERGRLENIDNLEDLLMPTEGKTLQEKAFLIHVLHYTPEKLRTDIKRKIFKNINEDDIKKLSGDLSMQAPTNLSDAKAKELGLAKTKQITLKTDRNIPINIYEWYGTLTVGEKTERYRVRISPMLRKVLHVKPLRKVTRSGKYPFVGGALIRRPGFFQGTSLPRLIAPVCNAFNNIWNQKSDFQYFQNVPFGFYKPGELNTKQKRRIKPGDLFASDDPTSVNFPNLQRSMAWAMEDFTILNELLEKLTGAASYFMTNNKGTSGTATRDTLIDRKSEIRFGLWVKRLLQDICEAITMLLNMYQDWAPPDLGERILGEGGKRLFDSFTLDSIRGGYDTRMTPDVVAGSKAMEREIALWGVEQLQNTIWFNPQINPRGNWQLVKNAAEAIGVPGIDNIMPPQPPAIGAEREDVQQKWAQIAQGEIPEVKPTDDTITLYEGLMMLKEEKGHELSEEVKPKLDKYLFDLSVAMVQQMKEVYAQMMADKMAQTMVLNGNNPRFSVPMGNMGGMNNVNGAGPKGAMAVNNGVGGVPPAS